MSVVAQTGYVPFNLRDALCQVIEPLRVAVVCLRAGAGWLVCYRLQ